MTKPDNLDISISEDDLSGPEIAALLTQHLQFTSSHSPAQSCHALDLDGLRRSGITFWSVRARGRVIGCGALQSLSPLQGEIKSMHVLESCRRQGIAARILRHIIATAQMRGYRQLFLETGSMDAFASARALYQRHGFEECAPFADYVLDPYSTFMMLELPNEPVLRD